MQKNILQRSIKIGDDLHVDLSLNTSDWGWSALYHLMHPTIAFLVHHLHFICLSIIVHGYDLISTIELMSKYLSDMHDF